MHEPSMKPSSTPQKPDLLCFSHLRWNFVYQRPQHLMSRAALSHRVIFFEEPLIHRGDPRLHIRKWENGPLVAVPYLPAKLIQDETAKTKVLRKMLDEMMSDHDINSYLCWYYTPLARKFSRHLNPVASIYDCMDELSNFKDASKDLMVWEKELFSEVDLVFTGGHSLYHHKKSSHPHVYAFPSSVDTHHFARARGPQLDPQDQAAIAHPRLGYIGVIDERIDLELIDKVAELRPDWQIIMVGPIAKIEVESLPHRRNIHYLGSKKYDQLPAYLSGWDLAFMPFARNEATRYISPTKTPEYLAAGRRVISTSIRDVVFPYEAEGLVTIADDASSFVQKAERYLTDQTGHNSWLKKVDQMLASQSWDQTFAMMWRLVDIVYHQHLGRFFSRAAPPMRQIMCGEINATMIEATMVVPNKKKGA